LASSEALAAILVPSIATVPNRAKPACAATSSTWVNNAANASWQSARNRATVEWSGTSWAHSTRNATSVPHNRSTCREDRTPRQ